jgi:hypothetical protein
VTDAGEIDEPFRINGGAAERLQPAGVELRNPATGTHSDSSVFENRGGTDVATRRARPLLGAFAVAVLWARLATLSTDNHSRALLSRTDLSKAIENDSICTLRACVS